MIDVLLKGKGGGGCRNMSLVWIWGWVKPSPSTPPNLIVGSKFPVFALFYFVFESNFPSTSPWGGGGEYIWRRDLTEVFLRYEFQGPIFGGAYFRNFTVSCRLGHLRGS